MNGRTLARTLGTAAAVAALTAGLAACGGAATTAGPAETASAADPVATTCASLLALDAVPSPDGDPSAPPDPEGTKAWGGQVLPLLTAAEATAPAEVKPALTALQPAVQAAATQGTPIAFDDPTIVGNIGRYEAWAFQSCGYQQVSLMGADFRFDGMPATLRSGPTAIQMMNHSAANQAHVLLIAKAPDPSLTVEQFVAMPIEQLMTQFETLPGAVFAMPGQQGGLLVDLRPGTYFMICPVGEEYGVAPHFLQGMINKVTVT